MIKALSQCFWRTCKKDVWDQLGIPVQTSSLKTLQFSPVEEHFYMRQHSECQRKFNEKMLKFSDLNIKLKSLDRKTAHIIMTPLLSLRQVITDCFNLLLNKYLKGLLSSASCSWQVLAHLKEDFDHGRATQKYD